NKTVRMSVSATGAQAALGADSSLRVDISADGRFVVFDSLSPDLVSGDGNAKIDIFVHDRDLDGNGIFDEAGVGKTTTVRVSVDSSGAEATGPGFGAVDASISDDGRFVAFYGDFTNLVANDTNGVYDVFVHDRDADG